ncbi:MAG TPA: glycosyltransferase [Puia sp.]|nr:glycosyltransferase [Puia sp.]
MNYDIICFSHLRWSFVYQRPQHLMNRLAARHRIFFIEEPVVDSCGNGRYFQTYHDPSADVNVITPHLPTGSSEQEIVDGQAEILKNVLRDYSVKNYISWYYSPMALSFSNDLDPVYTVYDCMDELSAFLFAPAALKQYEQALLQKADIVFTGGNSLFLAKRGLHTNIYSFPSSIDKDHFHLARKLLADPDDQRRIPFPRIGFYGVIDERLNICLLDQLSALRPDWQFVLMGPIVKIDPATLPRRENIHYLGFKEYIELPSYLSGWDIAMMPFALNPSTRFISPTKTPEYLAGGKPVISPSIADVVSPYGELGLVQIADTAEEFIDAAEQILRHGVGPGWLHKVDNFLSGRSWERTVTDMETLIEKGITETAFPRMQQKKLYV